MFDNQRKEEFFLVAAANVLTILFHTLYGLCLTGNDWGISIWREVGVRTSPK